MKTCNGRRGARFGAAMAGLLALTWSTSSAALATKVDFVELDKNGSLLYRDNFDNGLTPSQEPGVYAVFGNFPAGAEAGGRLTIDSEWGGMGTNALGQVRQTLNVTGLTGQNSADPTTLGRNDLISFGGVFDLVVPSGPLNSGYGIVLGERGAGGVLTHSLSLMVQYISSVGPVIRLFDQNFVTGTITVLDDIPLVVPLGADQIGFELSNEDTKSTSFEGSYAFVSNGVSGPGVTFAVAGPMFTMADTVRATVQVYSAVPEPSAWALGSIGMLALGVSRRRRPAAPSA